ncbi:hypothetical protein NP233_g8586 [Leucocoprinus birnbaumii]|uniref:Uncharacterized protein n=1 Tax=Leucocoprinus birnbaumii TaxID=56174 RepID=A0AAD5VQN0_9AGAR|nr:hypothetical protein NP233_g8586 [Leucocoprinus birnbaumii]
MFLPFLSAWSVMVLGVLGAQPALLSVKRYAGQVIPNSYLVKVKDAFDLRNITSSLEVEGRSSINLFPVIHDSQIFHGFGASLDEEQLRLVLQNPGVEYVEEDGVVSTSDIDNSLSLRAPVSHPVAGKNVDIYILDTGVFIDHTEFGGRASWGATFGGYPNADGNGHGTHLAGIAAGKTYGVAKLANIIAVKVLSDAGSGAISDIISGLSFVVQNAKTTGRSSVVLLALGGSISTTLDNAVLNVINSGISVVVGSYQPNSPEPNLTPTIQTVAGGSNTDASGSSPGRVVESITVAASTQSDSAASFSNFGSVIDLYAPGQNIISAGIASPNITVTFSGVSMAGAHVAGLAAYLLSLTGPITPATVASDLGTMSVKGALTNVPAGTLNHLASNNVSRIGITI